MQQHRTLSDWALLLALVAMWGSSFMFNKLGVATVAPLTVVAARLAIGALTLVVVLYARGITLPPVGRIWVAYGVLGTVGNALPFFLITWGQQVVDSALAGILMSIMPLATLVLAHFLVRGERMTPRRVGGFLLGFVGVVLLMGRAAFEGRESATAALQVISQLSVLCGALCYAANSVIARLLIRSDFLSAATGTLLVSAVLVVPLAVVLDAPWRSQPTLSSIVAIAWLGVGPTGIATILYYKLISAAGPTFMSLVNYLSPAVAVVLGVTLLDEHVSVNAYVGLVLILTGIAMSQWRRRPRGEASPTCPKA